MRSGILRLSDWHTPAFRLAYQKPAPTLRGVIDNLHLSVDTPVNIEKAQGTTAKYVNHRCHYSHIKSWTGYGNRFGGGPR